jgi:hypothetical protein
MRTRKFFKAAMITRVCREKRKKDKNEGMKTMEGERDGMYHQDAL